MTISEKAAELITIKDTATLSRISLSHPGQLAGMSNPTYRRTAVNALKNLRPRRLKDVPAENILIACAKDGWLGRGMEAAELAGLAISLPMPILLRGEVPADNYFPGASYTPSPQLINATLSTFDADSAVSNALRQISNRPMSMFMSRSRGKEVHKLAGIAASQLLKEDGPRVAVFDIDGFDTHAAQGNEHGDLAENLREFDSVIAELKENLGKEFDNTLVVSLTEFGRKFEQNGGQGTEHGYGTAILLAGGIVKQAKVHADWPGLRPKDLFEGQDLNATIDARAVYCSAMSACFDVDFSYMKKHAFWDEPLQDLTETLFQV